MFFIAALISVSVLARVRSLIRLQTLTLGLSDAEVQTEAQRSGAAGHFRRAQGCLKSGLS